MIGAYFFMERANKALVQRTFGLLELEARTSNAKEAQMDRYGPEFVYKEFMVAPGVVSVALVTMASLAGLFLLTFVWPVWD